MAPTIRYHSYKELKEYYSYLVNYDVVHLRFRLNSDENNQIMTTLEYSEFNIPYLAQLAALQGFYDYYLLEKYITTPLLDSNKIVISDRHYYDEVAFKSVYGCNYSSMLKLYNEIPVPDIAFYLSVPLNTIFQRNLYRSDGQTTLYKDPRLIKKLIYYFEKLLHDTNLVLIDGQQSIQKIQDNIITLLNI